MPSAHALQRAAAAAALGVFLGMADGGVVALRTVAYTGGPTPIAETSYAVVADPILSENGVTTFWAKLTGPSVTSTNDGVWISDRTGRLSTLVREGDAFDGTTIVGIPSLTIGDFQSWAYPVLSLATPNNSSTANLALARSRYSDGTPQELETILRDTISTPLTFDVPYRPVIRPAGAIHWSSATGVWRSDSTTRLVPRNPVPNIELLGGDATWRFNGFGQPDVDDIGRQVFWGAAGPNSTTPSIASVQKTGLWRSDLEEAWLLAGEGLQIPGSPVGQVWKELGSQPRMFGGGVLFWARVAGTGVGTGNDTSLMQISEAGHVTGRIDAGQQFPGAPGERFGPIPPNFSMNYMRGEAALVVPIRNAPTGSNTALILAREGETTVLARRGDHAPGLAAGVVFDHFQKPAINDAMRVAFVAQVRGEEVTATNNRALFAMNRFQELVPVIRTGDFFALPNGSTKTIRRVIFQEESTLLGRSAYNSGGQLLFTLEFTDNTEAIVLANIDCTSDFNGDGTIDADDTIAFFEAWDSGWNTADVDGSGDVDGDDVVFFFARFDAGC